MYFKQVFQRLEEAVDKSLGIDNDQAQLALGPFHPNSIFDFFRLTFLIIFLVRTSEKRGGKHFGNSSGEGNNGEDHRDNAKADESCLEGCLPRRLANFIYHPAKSGARL